MNLHASRNRILPAVVVLIALTVNGAPQPRSAPGPQPVVKLAADPVLAVTQPGVASSRIAPFGSPFPSVGAPTRETAPPRAPSPAAAGMVIAVDPETGTPGPPSPDQWAELRSAATLARIRREAAVEMRRPDGAVGIDVTGWMQEFAVARTGPDGKPILGCVRPGEMAAPDSAAATLEIQ